MASPNPLRQTTGRKSKISKPIAGGRRHLRAAMGPNYRLPDGTADGARILSTIRPANCGLVDSLNWRTDAVASRIELIRYW
jgi:hypothetical protein